MYSLRHYYATMALTYNRMTVYTLAGHLGTSVAMIEQHYGNALSFGIMLKNNVIKMRLHC